MKTTTLVVCCTIALGLLSCGSQKPSYTEAEKNQLEEMIDAKTFRLNPRWANPLATRTVNVLATSGLLQPGSTPNRIDIIGTTAYLEVTQDSVRAELPYYGERQFGSIYNSANAGIQFKGVPEDFKVEYNEKKGSYYFTFDIINDLGEGFNVNGTLFPNLKTTFYINSTERLTIGYTGTVADTPQTE
ncbi:MAG: DUF4251 domain-containing protein [Bacteroidota bacterium]